MLHLHLFFICTLCHFIDIVPADVVDQSSQAILHQALSQLSHPGQSSLPNNFSSTCEHCHRLVGLIYSGITNRSSIEIHLTNGTANQHARCRAPRTLSSGAGLNEQCPVSTQTPQPLAGSGADLSGVRALALVLLPAATVAMISLDLRRGVPRGLADLQVLACEQFGEAVVRKGLHDAPEAGTRPGNAATVGDARALQAC